MNNLLTLPPQITTTLSTLSHQLPSMSFESELCTLFGDERISTIVKVGEKYADIDADDKGVNVCLFIPSGEEEAETPTVFGPFAPDMATSFLSMALS